MEEMNESKLGEKGHKGKKKKILFIVSACLIALLVIFVLLMFTAPKRVVGAWQSEEIYSEQRGKELSIGLVLKDNQTFTSVSYVLPSNQSIGASYGTWEMDGFSVKAIDETNKDVNYLYTEYTYNPLTNTLYNGPYAYHKVS